MATKETNTYILTGKTIVIDRSDAVEVFCDNYALL